MMTNNFFRLLLFGLGSVGLNPPPITDAGCGGGVGTAASGGISVGAAGADGDVVSLTGAGDSTVGGAAVSSVAVTGLIVRMLLVAEGVVAIGVVAVATGTDSGVASGVGDVTVGDITTASKLPGVWGATDVLLACESPLFASGAGAAGVGFGSISHIFLLVLLLDLALVYHVRI